MIATYELEETDKFPIYDNTATYIKIFEPNLIFAKDRLEELNDIINPIVDLTEDDIYPEDIIFDRFAILSKSRTIENWGKEELVGIYNTLSGKNLTKEEYIKEICTLDEMIEIAKNENIKEENSEMSKKIFEKLLDEL